MRLLALLQSACLMQHSLCWAPRPLLLLELQGSAQLACQACLCQLPCPCAAAQAETRRPQPSALTLALLQLTLWAEKRERRFLLS